MDKNQFLNRFEVLYNNITSNQAPGLNAYEISVFLTKAQDEIIKDYFNPKSNPKQEGFDATPKRQKDFSTIIVTAEMEPSIGTKFREDSLLYGMPTDYMFILNESIKVGGIVLQVIPITYEQYTALNSKPYKYPLKSQAWRIITNNNVAEIILPNIPTDDGDEYGVTPVVDNYTIRYVRHPKDIALGDYNGDMNVVDTKNPCELPESLHEEILQRAVELAKVAWLGDIQSTLTVGQRSE